MHEGMKRVLVLGGTGFIARRLVRYLHESGCEITVATSGRTEFSFEPDISSVRIDRFSRESMVSEIRRMQEFDVVFDQICFGVNDAQTAIAALSGRTGSYVMVSSAAVYNPVPGIHGEADFDPLEYTGKQVEQENYSYSDGKKRAEACMFRSAPFSVAAARFPMVLGHDDSSMRMQNHVMDVVEGKEISFPARGGKRNYIWVDDAGRFLCWLGMNNKEGPYNAGSPEQFNAIQLAELISVAADCRLRAVGKDDRENGSPYYRPEDHVVDTQKAESEGFSFTPFYDWFVGEVRLTVKNGRASVNSNEYYWHRS